MFFKKLYIKFTNRFSTFYKALNHTFTPNFVFKILYLAQSIILLSFAYSFILKLCNNVDMFDKKNT